MASVFQNSAMYKIGRSEITLHTDTFKVMLLSPSYTPDKDHEFVSDVNTYEVSGTGYTSGFGGAGRKTLSSVAWTKDNTNDRCVFDAADVTWSSLTITNPASAKCRYAAVIMEVTSDADSPIVGIVDFGADKTTNGGDFTVRWSSNGIFRQAQS
jgi:hypothetical protein